MAESEILQSLLLRLGSRKDVRLWRQNTGVGRSMDGKRVIRFGINGGGDASGLVAGGIRLEVETKTATGRAHGSQLAFEHMIRSMGGIYIRGSSVDQIEAALDDHLAGRCPHCGGGACV